MKTGMLLEKLINVAQATKTDFAFSMNMTPSGLSKILTGKRLPFLKEKRMFSRQAAAYFAEALYGHNCYLKFDQIFPVLYNFNSQYELEMFLAYALEYALGRDFAVENNEALDYPDKEIGFLGKKTILNMFCVIVSDYIISNHDVPLEMYSTLPIFSRFYADIFRRIIMVNPEKQKYISFNHFVDISAFEASYDEYNIDVLLSIAQAQQYCNLNLWKIKEEIRSSFLLLKGEFLLLFNIQIEGTPLMTFITHKGYLTVFFNSLMKKDAKKISYNRSEAIAVLEEDSSFIDRLIDRHIDAVYSFIPIGYLIEEKDLDGMLDQETIKKAMLKLFNSIMTKETVFCVTVDAMMSFGATGKAIIPLIGVIDIPSDRRITYLQRFNSYMDEDKPGKIKILNCDLPKVVVLCLRGLSIVYLMDSEYTFEKIHFFETDMINNILGSEVTDGNMKTMEFSLDLCNTYMDELSRRLEWD